MATRGLAADAGIFLTLCEYAAIAGDGTVTIVRGGIDRFAASDLPVRVQGTLFVQVEPGVLAQGSHEAQITIAPDEPDHEGYELSGQLIVDPAGGGVRFAVPVLFLAHREGARELVLTLDGVVRARLALTTEKAA